MITASFHATATQARLWPRYLAIFRRLALRLLKLLERVNMMFAASWSGCRNSPSPASEIAALPLSRSPESRRIL